MCHLVLQARAEDEVIVGHLPGTRHPDVFGLPVDAHHLASHYIDVGMQREPSLVSAAVCVTTAEKRKTACVSTCYDG